MKVKICGLTRVVDAVFAADCGADFLGMIFVPESPRCLEIERASSIANAAKGRAKLVGVFRDQPLDHVRRVAEAVGLDLVQLHGSETDGDIDAIGVPVIKTLNIVDTAPDMTRHPHAQWILFDTAGGGTGRRFDWSLIAQYDRSRPFLLAGGINPDNVGAAISLVRPDAIDVASGVESAPGIKDHDKIQRLIERVKRA